jgi:hypothetical protein
MDHAVSLQLQFIVAMRRVRQACPRWWSEDRIQLAMIDDPECFRLSFETDEAWQKVYGADSPLHPNRTTV